MPLQLKKTMHEQQECAHELLGRIQGLYENKEQKTPPPELDIKILEGLVQLYAIGTNIEDSKASSDIDTEDLTQVGEYGFNLLVELLQWAHTNRRNDFTKTARQLILSLGLWITEHGGVIQTLEPIVDAFAQIANKTTDSVQLTQLVDQMSTIIDNCADIIKSDLEQANPLRPWRVIHLNRAITATRSHNVTLIRRTFHELAVAFPFDSADFFTEGMHEMDRLNYPAPVKEVLQEFFDKYSRPKMN